MDLFCFASKNVDNIWLGVRAKLWAVATVSHKAMEGRVTKARKYLNSGSKGVLYCNPTQSFVVQSKADPYRVVKDVWPEAWVLPFAIEPLGDPSKQVYFKSAMLRWPVLQKRADYPNMPAAMNLTGTTVLVPVDISDADWEMILDDLAFYK